MFLDESKHAMDKKGRVFLPKRFQGALGRDAAGALCGVLTFGFEGCLGIYSMEGFAALTATQNTDTFADPRTRTAQRRFFRNTHLFTLDGSGRLLIPERYRKFADLEGEVIMLGVSNRAEVWNAERLAAVDDDDNFDDLGLGFDAAGSTQDSDQPGASA
ncbi:MAG: hypothetical protein P1V81_16595 [Planctomycetota bacterium]|nr:hypothetical protein [Planctomycetota bacterium]